MTWVDRLNNYVAHSRVGKYFQLDHSGHRRERKGTKFMTEIRAGITIFFAMVCAKKKFFFFLTDELT
jgi:AGZA family xanthine/uracil permease-like MFS transporter